MSDSSEQLRLEQEEQVDELSNTRLGTPLTDDPYRDEPDGRRYSDLRY
ncbi:MAG: hypothetical protein H0U18_10730 [Pyrinomonadaceae bacterium]|nr:hypothetical protein [Pyrinomonadaceae bacterium]